MSVPVGWAPRKGVGPQVSKFEQISSDDHQMSVVGEVPYLVSGGGELVPCLEWGGVPISQCIMGSGHMGTPMAQTDTCENITFP